MTRFALPSILMMSVIITVVCPAAEKDKDEKGFADLFNGKDLDGWTVMGKKEGFLIKDGVIRSDGATGGNWMRTKKRYKNYVLRMEWRVSKGGNSGVFIRCDEKGNPWETGYEVQILNAARDDLHCTGSLYGYAAVKQRPDDSPGKWHSFEIRCDGPKIMVKVDGKTTVDINQLEIEKAKKKPLEGHIGLQDSHSKAGHFIEFRKIRIKELGFVGKGV